MDELVATINGLIFIQEEFDTNDEYENTSIPIRHRNMVQQEDVTEVKACLKYEIS